MNYTKKLSEKNLKIEDLSKKLQQKIEELENLKKKYENEKENLSEEEIEEYDDVLNQFDEEIVAGIVKFNPEVHKKRLENAELMRVKRLGNKEEKVKVKEEKEQIDEELIREKIRENIDVVKKPQSVSQKVQIDDNEFRSKRVSAEKFDEIEQEQEQENENQQTVVYQNQHEIDEHEIDEAEDFIKKAEIKPKKSISLGVGLLGLGLFIASWGAINIIKSRR